MAVNPFQYSSGASGYSGSYFPHTPASPTGSASPVTPSVRVEYLPAVEQYRFTFPPRTRIAGAVRVAAATVAIGARTVASLIDQPPWPGDMYSPAERYVADRLDSALEDGIISRDEAVDGMKAWFVFQEKHFANGKPRPEPRPEPQPEHHPEERHRFPETVHPVLALLRAEVEMCQDELQQSRLQGILDSLVRFAPPVEDGPDDDVSSAS